MADFTTKVTDERQEFPTGSRRGSQAGKGRFDLLLAPLGGVWSR